MSAILLDFRAVHFTVLAMHSDYGVQTFLARYRAGYSRRACGSCAPTRLSAPPTLAQYFCLAWFIALSSQTDYVYIEFF